MAQCLFVAAVMNQWPVELRFSPRRMVHLSGGWLCAKVCRLLLQAAVDNSVPFGYTRPRALECSVIAECMGKYNRRGVLRASMYSIRILGCIEGRSQP